MEAPKSRPINILSLDGSESGLPALYILEEMLSRLKYDLKLTESQCPCDYFDLIGGTGTGALVALLLARMRMTINQALDVYMRLVPILARSAAKDQEEKKRNSKELEDTLFQILRDAGYDPDSPLIEDSGTKTLLFTLNTISMSTPYILRSYRTRSSFVPSCTILQSACASLASQDKFVPTTVGERHQIADLFDATFVYANPTAMILREAQEAFGGNVKVATIVSLGTESRDNRVPGQDEGHTKDKYLIARANAADCERVHGEIQKRLGKSGIYYRFKPTINIGTPSQQVYSHVCSYLLEASVDSTVDQATKSLHAYATGPSLKDINSVSRVEILLKPRPSLIANFVGREEVLTSMRLIHFNKPSLWQFTPSITVLTGLGGSGKTQIALKFALEYETRYPKAAVYFIDGSSESTIKTDLETIIRSQNANHRSDTHQDTLSWLAGKSKEWLLILDNVDDPSVKVSSFIPRCSHGHIVITTRDATRKTLAPESSHAIEGLETSDAVALLLNSSGYEASPINMAQAEEIVEELGHLPLALAHAAAYISIHQCLSSFALTYRLSTTKLLENSPDMPDAYPHSVAATIQMSLECLPPKAQDLLRLFAHLDARSIPYAILSQAIERQFRTVRLTNPSELQPCTVEQAAALMQLFCPDQVWEPALFDELISTCLRYSLLRVATQLNNRFYSMHVLVQSFLRHSSETIGKHTFPQLVVRLLGSAVTTSQHRHDHFAFNRLLLPHVRLIKLEDVAEAGDYYGFGFVLEAMGEGASALAHFVKCVIQWKQCSGENDGKTLGAMTWLGNCCADLGKQHEALVIRERVLKSYQNSVGDDDRSTIVAMSNLALSYSDAGRQSEALKLRETVLKKRMEILGDDDRDTLQAMEGLAVSYAATGRKQQALELVQKVLKRRGELLGDDHHETVEAMGNLALSYRKLGRAKEALSIEWLVLQKFARQLGKTHHNTLKAMSNLISTYGELGMETERQALLRATIPLFVKVYGSEHRNTLWLHKLWNTRQQDRPIGTTPSDHSQYQNSFYIHPMGSQLQALALTPLPPSTYSQSENSFYLQSMGSQQRQQMSHQQWLSKQY